MAERRAEEKRCPACGKPTAGYVPCPHCGADPRIRLSIRAVAVLCVVALLAGSGYFLLHRSTLGARPVLISSIDQWMNYASVWIEGTVIKGPRISEDYISFDVRDASGTIKVDVYPPENLKPENLKELGKIPMVGDQVKLFGMVRVYLDGSKEIHVSSLGKDPLTDENKFQVTPPAEPIKTSIENLFGGWYTAQSLKYKRVRLEGKITNLWPEPWAKKYVLEDNKGKSIVMYVHGGLVYSENRELDVKLLQTISVTAGAAPYIMPYLALASYDDVEVIENAVPPDLVEIENINENHRGQFVRTRGRVVFVEMVGKSDSLEVEKRKFWLDNKDNPVVWMWESVYKYWLENELLPDNKRELLRRGSAAELTGRVSSSGELEIELVGPPELELVGGTYEPPLVKNVAEIGSENVNDFVTVEGEVVSPIENVAAGAGLPSNRKFTLRDNLGETIKIWISNTVYERMPNPPTTWDNLSVVGKVTLSAGEIQVRPGLPSDVVKVS